MLRPTTVIVAAIGALVIVAAALAAKPGRGRRPVSARCSFRIRFRVRHRVAHRSEDSDAAGPLAGYHDVTLTNLDRSGFLHGDYATVSETGNPAYSPTNTFRYTHHQDEFEQVMAYYWITEAQKYIHSLGFGVTRRAIDNQPQRVRINQ